MASYLQYCGDAEDKQWLYDNNMMPATGGKAYMLILEDIKELIESEEYRYELRCCIWHSWLALTLIDPFYY